MRGVNLLMDAVLFSANAVLPLFFLVATGYFIKKRSVIDNSFIEKANTFCFNVAFPALVFNNIYRSDLAAIYTPGLFLLPIGGILLAVAAAWFIVPLLIHERAQIGVVVQGIFRSNFVIFGLPLVVNIFGPEAAAPTSLLLAVVAPLFNVLAVLVLTAYQPTSSEKRNLGDMLLSILKNPLIIASIAAILLSQLHLQLPLAITRAVSDLSMVATPLALIILGGQFEFEKIAANFKPLFVATFGRLVLLPGIMVTAAILLGYRGIQLAPIFGLFATPTAIVSHIMAKSMGSDGELAGQIVLSTTLFSLLTIFLGVFLMRTLGIV